MKGLMKVAEPDRSPEEQRLDRVRGAQSLGGGLGATTGFLGGTAAGLLSQDPENALLGGVGGAAIGGLGGALAGRGAGAARNMVNPPREGESPGALRRHGRDARNEDEQMHERRKELKPDKRVEKIEARV